MGEAMLDFELANYFRLANTLYKKQEHLITFKSEKHRSWTIF